MSKLTWDSYVEPSNKELADFMEKFACDNNLVYFRMPAKTLEAMFNHNPKYRALAVQHHFVEQVRKSQ